MNAGRAGGLDSSVLVVAATVGTGHRAVDLTALPESVRPDPLPADPAFALLDAAALTALAHRTVPPTVPARVIEVTRPAPEPRAVVPEVVRQVLGRVTNQTAILVEALTMIHRAGLRLPPDLVPGLLDDTRPEVVAATRPVIGEIGRLLTTKNLRWAAPAEPDPADRTVWDEGTTAERAAWLRELRRVDPAAARDLLTDSMSDENAATRAEFLAVLADGLSPADQDLLLAAVGDRSRLVVAVAMDLLLRLPESPLRRDMRSLAARHLTVGLRPPRTTIRVTDPAPAEFAPWPLSEGHPWPVLLGRVDPAQWPQIFGADLLDLVAAGAEELRPLWSGFRSAAITFRHAGLARILVAGRLSRPGGKAPPAVDPALWAVLGPPDATELLDRLLAGRRVRPDQVTSAVSALSRPWPAPLGRRLAGWLPATGTGTPAPGPLWELWAAATALPDCREMAALARQLSATPGESGSGLLTRAGNAANQLTLRAVLYETLCTPGGTT